MAIVFRLPTWNITVTPYLFDPLTGTWSLGIDIEGQLYTMKRVAEVIGTEAMYFVHPKEDTQLRDPSVFNLVGGDVLLIDWRGVDTYWRVDQHVPRWMGFINEHCMALLTRLTSDEEAEFLGNLQPVDVDLSSVTASPDDITGDDIMVSNITVTLLDSFSNPIPGKTVNVTTTGAGTIDDPTGVTDAMGQFTTTYHSPTPETVTFSAVVPSQGVTVGPSNVLTVHPFVDPQSIDDWLLDVSGVGNDGCSDCVNANGSGIALSRDSSFEWSAAPVPFGCEGGFTDAQWELNIFSIYSCELHFNAGGSFSVASYFATVPPGWNGTDPLTFDFVGGSSYCTWPATITITPD